MNSLVITVSQLNGYVRSLLSGDANLSSIFVKGELSDVKYNVNGHIFFTLKDGNARVGATMFQSYASRLRFTLENGLSVICGARADLWEKEGRFQLYVRSVQPEGIGELALAFMQTKEKLESEGLFSAELKRPLNPFPKTVAVVTSETGAAVKDIIQILNRRNPMVRILLCPVFVQGERAVESMVSALNEVYGRTDVDTIIIGRGGGSAEDLSCFNSEVLARVVRASRVPVISAVGHETDFTICDYVADIRAPTPSAAAELAAIDVSVLRSSINGLCGRINNAFRGFTDNAGERFSPVCSRLPNAYRSLCADGLKSLEKKYDSVLSAYRETTERLAGRIETLSDMLNAFSPLANIFRGYAVVVRGGDTVSDVEDLVCGDEITVYMKTGKIEATVKDIELPRGGVVFDI